MEVYQDDQSLWSRFDDLPVEITRKILEKLPIDSLARCKLLNKSFRRIISDQQFAINFFSHSVKKNPFVFISHRLSFYLLNMDSSDRHEFKKINIPFQLPDVYIIGSCNGYLCLSFSSAPIRSSQDRLYPWGGNDLHDDVNFIWNPLTSHFIELPLSSRSCSHKYGLGFNPLTQKYKVVKIYDIRDSHGREKTSYMQVLTVGTDNWRTLKAPSNLNSLSWLRSDNRGVCVNGSIYWTGKNDNNLLVVLALDLATEEFTEIRAPYDIGYWVCQNLTDIRGCPAMLIFPNEHLEIWTLKDSWTLQGIIKNYMDKIHLGMQMKIEGGELASTSGYVINPNHVVCLLEDDKLLMYYGLGGILCYDLNTEVFVDFKIRGLLGFGGHPVEYEEIMLVGSLICIN